jgi:hypothetical protein
VFFFDFLLLDFFLSSAVQPPPSAGLKCSLMFCYPLSLIPTINFLFLEDLRKADIEQRVAKKRKLHDAYQKLETDEKETINELGMTFFVYLHIHDRQFFCRC